MFPLASGLLTGGASLLSGLFSNMTASQNSQNQIAAQEQMQTQSENFNAAQTQQQEQFQQSMSSTAYQRASADMQKAGLNPMMMFGSGSAASSPSGAAASVGTPTVPMSQAKGPLSGLGDAVQKGLDSAVTAKTMDKMTEEIANLKTQNINIAADTAAKQQEPDYIKARTALTNAQTKRTGQDIIQQAPATTEAQGVSGLGTSTLNRVGVAKYGAGALGDVLAPVVSSATRVLGLDILKNAMKARSGIRIRPGSALDSGGSTE